MHSRSRFAGSVLASAFAAVAAVAAIAPARAPSATPKPSPAPAPIGAGAVWKPPEGFRDRVTAVCGAAGGKFADCFVAQMKKAGASKEALEFTRRIGNQGYLTAFVESGRVDIAYAEYPFRANENSLVFLVNGAPPLIDVDDPASSGLDPAKLEANPAYAALKKRYPNLAVFPSNRTFPRGAQPTGSRREGQRFTVAYELHDGCHACRTVGIARVVFEFDAQGQFTGARVSRIRSTAGR